MKKDIAIFLLLIVLCAIVTALNPRFLSPANLQNTARLIGAFGIFSLGLGLVIITGGIDLSVGSSFALLGVLLSMMLTEWHLPWPLAVVVIVGLAALLGTVHGLLITRLRLQPFVVTLCGLLVYRGLARFIADDETKGFGDAAGFHTLQQLMTGSFFGVPTPFVAMALIGVVMWVVLHRSVYGRHLFATRRNEVAARVSGSGLAVFGHRRAPSYRERLRDPRSPHGHLGDHLCVLYQLDLTIITRQLLRAVPHRGTRAGRVQPARRRGLDRRHPARDHAAPGAAEPGEPAGHSKLAQFRRDGWRHTRRRCR